MFIIIAVVVVAFVGGYFLLRNTDVADIGSKDANVVLVTNFVDSCLEDVTNAGVNYVALQGGYYDKPVLSNYYLFHNVPYYWSNIKGVDVEVPSLNIIEGELARYINNYLPPCLENLDSNVIIEIGDADSSVSILDKAVRVNLDYPIKVQTGDKTTEIKKFSLEISSSLKSAHGFANQIIGEQMKNPNSVPVSYLADISTENDFTFETINLDDNTVLYSLLLNEGTENSLTYNFVSEYNWKVEEVSEI